MKIILSRKGFDSSAGGYASPILDGKRLISLPIPENMSEMVEDYPVYNNRYSSLKVNENMSYLDLMNQLLPGDKKKLILESEKIDLNQDTICHFDPQINSTKNDDKNSKYKGLFGQSGSANSHLLKTCKVTKGDLFLFFGWFKDTQKIDEKYKFIPDSDKHVIWGWLEINEIVDVSTLNKEKKDHLNKHPHLWMNNYHNNNSIYLSTDKLCFNNRLPGAGVFPYDKSLVLTKDGMSRSKWDLPSIFKDRFCNKNYNKFNDDYFQSVYRGQEFVIEADDQIIEWVKDKFSIMNVGESE
ncbi:MAG TPA: hypothetical protein PKJ08_03185 [Candidatus Cloacimonadota bacterium]|nr:hypothetical protein [Candidatus Cloacimonadota bacterium]